MVTSGCGAHMGHVTGHGGHCGWVLWGLTTGDGVRHVQVNVSMLVVDLITYLLVSILVVISLVEILHPRVIRTDLAVGGTCPPQWGGRTPA